ncbi:MAG: hypothetical protein LBG19_07375 [Prevotellaceae bacterium]|jgi:hypothetical protein|nr:hypothetical protein [Prevotellaceae bacterium]
MKNIFKFLIGILTIIPFVSCGEEDYGYNVDTGAGFALKKIVAEVDPGLTSYDIKVVVARGNTGAAATFQLIVSNESANLSGVLSIPQSVTFEQGESVAEVVIPVTVSALGIGVYYNFTLTLESSQEQIAANSKSINISTNLLLEWEDVGEGEYDPALFTGTWDLTLQKAAGTNFYRLLDAIEYDYHFIFEVKADNTIIFGKQETGYVNGASGMIWYTQSASKPSRYDGDKTYTFGVKYTNGGTGTYGDFTDTFVLY